MSVNHNLSQAETFWRQLLTGFTAPTPLVVDRVSSDGSDQDGEYGQQEIRLSKATTTTLQSLLQQHQLMFETIIQGAWALLLSRYNGEENVLFGATRAGRRSTVEGAETIVGLLTNTLPVRVRVPPEKPLLSWLEELETQHITSRKYEHISLPKIQEWSDIPSEMPLFESVLIFENNPSNSTLQAPSGDLKNRNLRLPEQTNYPLTVRASLDSEILLKITYNRHRFDEATISRMLGHLKTVLEGMAPKSGEKLSTLPLLTEKERHQMLVEWNDTQANYRQDQCLHHLFEAQVERTPEAIALIFEDQSLCYRELNRRANQLAHHLQRLGVGPEVMVGIYLERSLEMVIGLLGILKAGGAYVPLDPAYPQERLDFMLTDTQAPVLITQTHLTAWLAKIKNLQVVCLDTDWDTIVQESEANPVTETTANNLAYVIYTSGSTGTP